MLNFSTTKIVSIYITFLLISFFVLLNFLEIDKSFFKKKINLGLDLQGGSYLLLEVDSKLLEKKMLQSKVLPLKKKLNSELIKYDNFKIEDQVIKFDINNKDLEKFKSIFTEKKNDSFNLFLEEYNAFELEKTISDNSVKVFFVKTRNH